jgi:hypothetical protein
MKRVVMFALLVVSAITSAATRGQVGSATLSFSATVVAVGTPAVIDLLIDCQVELCAAADISMKYDPQALRIDAIAPGDFLKLEGKSTLLLESRVDAAAATITLRYLTLDDTSPASETAGVLLHITATALMEGASTLQFARALVAPHDGEPVFAAQVLEGTVLAHAAQERFAFSVHAEASLPEQVAVIVPDAALVSETIVGDRLHIEVAPQASPAAALTLDAPGHLACTTALSQQREITLRAGDVNDDGRIDIYDAAVIGVTTGSGAQEDQADLNHDGVINIYDLIHVGRNYGRSSGEC